MRARWVVVVALFAGGCGGAFEAESSGSDASTSSDSRLDSPVPDAQGAEGGGGADDGVVDGGSGIDGGKGEGGGDASLDSSQDAGRDSGEDAGSEAGMDAGKDSGPEAGKDASPEGGKDAGGDGGSWSPVCPANAPAPATTCQASGLQCEYPQAMNGKAEYDISCDTVVECSDGIWTVTSLGGACDPDGTNSVECPASLAGIASGESCSDKQLRCEYPKGVCTCAVNIGGVELLDAGATWTCDPGAGCPMPRPRLGSACGGSTVNLSCIYEMCSYAQTCENDVWQAQGAACGVGVGAGSP